jgi:hypothetical protein
MKTALHLRFSGCLLYPAIEVINLSCQVMYNKNSVLIKGNNK